MTPTPSPADEPKRCERCGAAPGYHATTCPFRPTPGPVEGRPGGWVDGIGWVVRSGDVHAGDEDQAAWPVRPGDPGTDYYVLAVVTRWADGTTPAPPASPADDAPDADAVAFQNGYQIGVRVGSEHHGPCRGLPPASPAPPTPTPCPYIVTGGEGTSHCSLAERSAMHAAVPPTPTPQADRPRIWVDSEGDLIVGESAGPTIGIRLGRTMVVYRDYGITDDEAIAALTRPAPPSTPAEQPEPDGGAA